MMKGMHHTATQATEMYPPFTAMLARKDFVDTAWLEEADPDVEFRQKVDNDGKIVYEIIAEC